MAANTPMALESRTIGQFLGVEPKQDPESGLSFYLWDDMFPTNETGRPKPSFGAQEAAKIFFGKGADWLRWRYRPATEHPDGYFVLGDKILEPKRTESGQRYYTLADIERMAHALAQNDAIDGRQVMSTIAVALFIARVYAIV
jgi:hypothetical protein